MEARYEFYKAKEAYPQYQKVKEIYVKLKKELAKSNIKKKKIAREIVGDYSWTMNDDLKEKIASASRHGRKGFEEILKGNLRQARTEFGKAYKAYPVYQNVDEIYNLVLRDEVINNYEHANSEGKKEIKKNIMGAILKEYSWGMTYDIKKQMKAQLKK